MAVIYFLSVIAYALYEKYKLMILFDIEVHSTTLFLIHTSLIGTSAAARSGGWGLLSNHQPQTFYSLTTEIHISKQVKQGRTLQYC